MEFQSPPNNMGSKIWHVSESVFGNIFESLGEHFGNQEKSKKQNCCNWRTADPSSSLPDAHYWRHVSKYGVTTCTGIWTSSLLHTAAIVSGDVSLIIFPVTTKFLLLHFNQMLAACVPASSWKLTVDGWENKDDKNSDFHNKLSAKLSPHR